MGLELLASTCSIISIMLIISSVFTPHNLPDHKPALSSTATQSRRTPRGAGLLGYNRFQYIHIIHYLHPVYRPVYRRIPAPL